MTQHVNSICRTGYYHLRNIGRICRYLSHDTAKTLVHALLTSIIDYCNSLLHGLPLTQFVRIQHLQKTCARIFTRISYCALIIPILKALHWLPVHCLIQYTILFHTFRTIHHKASEYLSGLLSVYRPEHSL